MRLYEFGPTRALRARWTLQELGVAFEAVSVNMLAGENLRPDFLKLNPAGKLPVLVDGDQVLTEMIFLASSSTWNLCTAGRRRCCASLQPRQPPAPIRAEQIDDDMSRGSCPRRAGSDDGMSPAT